MSMTGAGRAAIYRNLGTALPFPQPSEGHQSDRESTFPCLPQLPRSAAVGGALQAGFAGPHRRTSFVGILHQMSAQNRLLLPSPQDGSRNAVRRVSVSDVPQASAVDSKDMEKQEGGDLHRRRTSDGAPRYIAPTSHTVSGDYDDVIKSRDQGEYTVNVLDYWFRSLPALDNFFSN